MTLVLSFVLPLLMEDRIEALTVVGLMMACWIAILAFAEMKVRISKKIKLTPSYWGMVLAHLGLAVTIVGIAFSQNYSVERDVKMKPGDSINIRAYTFTFNGVREADGPNYQGVIGSISVTEKGKVVSILMPEKRFYNVSRAVMTEAAIDGGFTRDLYAALGEEISKSTWSMRLYYKPFVRWIWSGGVLMAVGALFCMFDPRYRRRKLQRETA